MCANKLHTLHGFNFTKGENMANQEANVQLQQLEEEANQLIITGNTIGALEVLEKAMEIEKRWYHLYTKASWLYELPEKKFDEMWKVVQEGFSRFPEQRFWFYYLGADVRYHAVLIIAPKGQRKLEDSLVQLLEAQTDTDSAYYELQKRPDVVKATLDNLPRIFPPGWHKVEIKEVFQKLVLLKNNIRSVHQLISTMKYVFETENRINSRIDKQEGQMQSEKMRTIEILGFFTAIMAFVILLGNIALKTTYNEAMPILGGLSLVLILFVTVASLVTSKFYRYRDILKDVRCWLAFSLIIILSLLVWDSQKEKHKPEAASIYKSPTQATVDVLNKETMN